METTERTMSWAYADSGEVRLDRQHESLIHLTEALNEVIGGSGGDDLAQLLCEFLGRRLRRHFRTEEVMIRDKGDLAGLTTCHDSHARILRSFASVQASIGKGTIAQTARLFNAFRLAMACHDRQVDGPLFERLGIGGHMHSTSGESASRIPLYADVGRVAAGRLSDGIPIHDG